MVRITWSHWSLTSSWGGDGMKAVLSQGPQQLPSSAQTWDPVFPFEAGHCLFSPGVHASGGPSAQVSGEVGPLRTQRTSARL